MLCEKCKVNQADTHIKRTVNGKTKEYHLCRECAEKMGYDSMFDSFMPDMKDLFGGFLGMPIVNSLASPVRCSVCGSSYENIRESGMVGCANCYKTFYRELLPSIKRIHGNTVHTGKRIGATAQRKPEDEISALKTELQKAIAEQEFERAAGLRDQIKALEEKD